MGRTGNRINRLIGYILVISIVVFVLAQVVVWAATPTVLKKETFDAYTSNRRAVLRRHATFSSITSLGRITVGISPNYGMIDTSLGLRLVGTAINYDDLQFNLAPTATGVGHPTLTTFFTPLEEWLYARADHASAASQELPHNWVALPGTTNGLGELHIHFSNNGALAKSNRVWWKAETLCAPLPTGTSFASWSPVKVRYAQYSAGGTVADKSKLYASFGNWTSTACAGMAATLKINISKIAPVRGTEKATTSDFAHQVGLHHGINSLGSNATSTKSATP